MKETNKKLKREIDNLKKVPEKGIKMKLLSNIINGSYTISTLSNTFITFKSINNILYLIYANKNKSIICYDLIAQKKTIELKNSHNQFISNFRHYLEEINKRDLLMSISAEDNNIKIWNANNWECILDLNNINNLGKLYSACFLNINNNIYLISSNANPHGISDPIKVFNLKGQKINEIQNSNEYTIYIDTYYDNILSKYYLITGNSRFSKSYDNKNNFIYYKDVNNCSYCNIIIKNNNNIIKLIASCSDGIIRIYNFHSGSLINKIIVSNHRLSVICFWNNNYLFAGCKDKTIKILDIKNGIIIKNLDGHFEEVLTIQKIMHPKYGKCLLSQNWKESQIKLWINDITYFNK